MISSVQGRLEAIGNDWVIVNVNGIGLQVFVPTSTLTRLGAAGDEVKLHTHLHVREDVLALYGFAAFEDLSLFQTVTGVSGVGPKLGLAMLSAMSAEQLIAAIASGDPDMLTGIPGIGKKMAARIVLELKDKIGTGLGAAPLQTVQGNADVLGALTALGYSVAEASRAVASLPGGPMSLEEKVRLALAYFARK